MDLNGQVHYFPLESNTFTGLNKETRPEMLERISQLVEKGKRDSDEMAEYSIKFYYTNQVTKGKGSKGPQKESTL